jgi:hypothetical protein
MKLDTVNMPLDSKIEIIRDSRGFYFFRIEGRTNGVSYKTAERAFSDALDVASYLTDKTTGEYVADFSAKFPLAFSVKGIYTERISKALGNDR